MRADLGLRFMVILAVFCFGIAPPAHASSLTGLMALKNMAPKAMPYEVAIANRKPTFLEFYADWCSTCQAMAPAVQTLHERYGSEINFVMLNVDDPQWSPQIDRYQVNGIPQMTLLDGDQIVLDTWIGQVPAPILSEELSQLFAYDSERQM